MANEGSTKPTYSELEVENLRVRGLLQRTSENMEAMCLAIARNDGVMCAETVNMAAKLAISLRQGAESADIGKLDTADKSGVQMWAAVEMFEDDWDEPRPLWEDLPEADRNSYIKMAGAALRVFKVSQMLPKELDAALAGSAETGGEKAAPEKCGRFADPPNLDDCTFHIHLKKRVCDDEEGTAYVAHILELDIVAVDPEPWRALEKLALLVNRQIEFGLRHGRGESIWFPAPKKFFDDALRLSDAQAQGSDARPGVGTAVESNSADEKGESREPGKLNNAQKCTHTRMEPVIGPCGCCENEAWLAESSLSSPPPKKESDV